MLKGVECINHEDCSGGSDTCISNFCHCGSNVKCSERADTCTAGICRCSTNEECSEDKFCYFGACQGL